MSPTQRTLAKLKADGLHAAVTERWNPYAKIRQDVWGFADILAFSPSCGDVLLIQCTSGSNVSARVAKVLANPIARQWAKHYLLYVVGWRKAGLRGKRKTWQARTLRIYPDGVAREVML